MESAKLEIVPHFGKDLIDVKHLSTMDPYVIVWIAGDGNETKKTTHIAENGACNPSWECAMDFDIVSMNKYYIIFFEIKHGGTLFDRKIGEVQVPFADLLAENAPRDRVGYLVTTPSGEKKGEIVVSYKFSELVVSSDEDDSGDLVASSVVKKNRSIAKRIAKKVTEKVALVGAYAVAEIAMEFRLHDLFG